MRSAIFAVLALFLLPAVTRGQEEIHRKIYVPLDEWEQVLEEEPRGLMLTKVEYDDLIERAKANLKHGEVDGPPPVGAAISGATYEATLEGQRCVVDANFEIEFLRDGWVLLPLGLEGTAPSDATLGETKALLRRNRVGGFFLLARGKGKASLRIPFSSAAEESAEGYLIRFGLAPSAAGTFRFRATGEWEISEAGRSGVVAYDAATGETRFSTPIGGRRRITLHVARRKEGKERRPVILLDKELTLLIDDAAIDAWWDLDYTVLREKRATFEIGLPAGFDLTEVSTPDLLDWRVLQNGNLQITLQNDAEGHVPVTVRMRTGIPAGGEVQTPHLSGVDADRQWGRMQILLLGGQRGRLVRLEGAREIPVGEAAPSNGNAPPVSRQVFRSFAWSGDSPKVTLEVERPPPRLLADVRTLVTVTDEGVWFRTIIGYEAIEGEALSLSPQLPADLELFALQAEGATIEWREEEEGRIWVGLSSKLTGKDKVYLMAEGRLPGGDELAIPRIVAGAEREEGYLSFAVEGGYSLRGSEIRGLDPIDARLSTQIMGMDVKGAKLCYRYRDPHYGGKILVREEKPEINLETVEYISLVEDTLKFQIQLGYEFLRAGAREVRFILPKGTGEIEIQGDGYKEKSRTDEEDGEHWKVTFQAPALGRRHLFVTFEQKLSDVSEVPMLVAIGVERQRGYVAVEASAESEITLKDPAGLREVDPAEVPDHARYKPEQKVLFAYRYVTADRSVGFSAQRHDKGKVHQAVVSSFEADVQCNPWGAEKVTATYTIQQTSMQWLEFVLPAGSELWAAKLDGVGVKPVREDRRVVIPLEGKGPRERKLQLIYSTRSRSGMRVASALPQVDYPVRISTVRMHVPGDQIVIWAGGEYAPQFVLGGRSGLRLLWEKYRATALTLLLLSGLGYLLVRMRETIGEAVRQARWRYGTVKVGLMGGLFIIAMIFGVYAIPGLVKSRSSARSGWLFETQTKAMGSREAMEDDYEGAGLRTVSSRQGEHGFNLGMPKAPPPANEPVPDMAAAARNGYAFGDDEDEANRIVGSDLTFQRLRNERRILGGSSGRVGGGSAGGSRPRRAAIRQQLDLQGLASLALDFPEMGAVLPFRRQGSGGAARLLILSGGTFRAIAVLAFVGCLLGGLLAIRRGHAVAILAILLGVTILPEVLPTFSGPANAGLSGLLLALIFAAFVWGVGRLSRLSVKGASVALLLVLIPTGLTWAQEPIPPAPGDAMKKLQALLEEEPRPARLRERRVYIPYDSGDPGALDEGGKLYLPYDEFMRLWNLAHPGIVDPAAFPYAVTRAEYRTLLEGDVLAVTADFRIRTIRKGWTEVPLGLAGARIESVLVNGETGSLRGSKAGYSFLAETAGSYRVTVTFQIKGQGRGGAGFVEMFLAGSPISPLTLRVADANRRARIEGAPSGQWAENGHIRADLGGMDRLRISWESGEGVGAEVALRARTLARLHLGEDHVSLTQETIFETSGGKVDTFRFRISEGFRVHSVKGEWVRSWGLEGRGLVVSLFQPREGKIPIEVEGESSIVDGKAGMPTIRPAAVEMESGALLVDKERHLNVRVTGKKGLRTVEADGWNGPPSRGELVRTYRFVSRPIELESHVSVTETETAAVVRQDLTVSPREVIQVIQVQETIHQGRVFDRQIRITSGYRLDGFTGPIRDAWVDEGLLHIVFDQGLSGGASYSISLSRREVEDQKEFGIPLAWIEGAGRQRGSIAMTGSEGTRLLTKDLQGLRSTDPRRLGGGRQQRVADLALAYSEAYSGALLLGKEEAQLEASWILHVEAAGDVLEMAVRIEYRTSRGSVDTVSFSLPAEIGESVRLVGDGLRETPSRVEGDRRIWTVTLQAAFTDRYSLGVYFDRKFEPGVPLPLPTLGFPDADEREGHILIQKQEALARIDLSNLDGLELVPAHRLSALPSGVAADQILKAYRKVSSPWSLGLAVQPLDIEKVAGVHIHYMKMETVVQEDGLSWNRASIRIRNQKMQFLRLLMPEGSDLLSVFVADEASRYAEENNLHLIPLPTGADGDLAFSVDLVYTLQLGDIGGLSTVEPLAPKIESGVNVSRIFWTLRLPESARPLRFGGDMEEIGAEVIPTLELQAEVQDLKRLTKLSETGGEVQKLRAGLNLRRQVANVEAKLLEAQKAGEIARFKSTSKSDSSELSNKVLLDRLERESAQYRSKENQVRLATGQTWAAQKDAKLGEYGKRVEETLRKNIQLKKTEKRADKWGSETPADDAPASAMVNDALMARGRAAKPAQQQFEALYDKRRRGALQMPPEAGQPAGAGRKVVGGKVAGTKIYSQRGAQVPALRARGKISALSLPVSLPEGGTAYHFKKEGRDAELTALTSSRSFEGASRTLIKVFALAILFGVLVRLGWVTTGRLSSPVGLAASAAVVLAISAMVASTAVSAIVLAMGVVVLRRAPR